MFKEKGYDEFLAASIKRGEEDIAAGRVVTLEEAKKQWRQAIERKALEIAEFEEEQGEMAYA